MDLDHELLRQFVDQGSQEAFAELVRRRIGLVYAAALRQTGGDSHLAQDVTQGVFVALARQAPALRRHAALAAWLYTTTRFLATKAVRQQARWQRREQEANAMTLLPHDSAPAWNELRPVIDEAMHALGEKDRTALLLRYFEGRTTAEIGTTIGLTENAARMRVARALDKLHDHLARRGITSTATALGLALANQPAIAVPSSLIAAATAAGASVSEAAGWWTLAEIMGMTKTRIMAASAVLALGVGSGAILHWRAQASLAKVAALTGRQAQEIATLRAAAGAESGKIKAPVAPGAVAISAHSLARLQALLDLQREGVAKISLPFFDDMTGRLHPDFATLFDLAPGEVAVLQQVWESACRQIGELAVAHATTRRTLDGRFVIEVEPFEGGGPIYDQFMVGVERLLGPERNRLFVALMAGSVGGSLNQFGAEARTLTVNSGPPAADGSPTFLISDQRRFAMDPANLPRVAAPGRPGTFLRGDVGLTRNWVEPRSRAELLKRYGPIARLVPLSL